MKAAVDSIHMDQAARSGPHGTERGDSATAGGRARYVAHEGRRAAASTPKPYTHMTECVWRRPSETIGLALPGWGFDGAIFDLAPWSVGLSTPRGTCMPIGWSPLPIGMDEQDRGASNRILFTFDDSARHAAWLAGWSTAVHGTSAPPVRQVMFGWSMGAWFAVGAALARPGWWSRVILAGAPVRFPNEAIQAQADSLAADPQTHLAKFRQRSLMHERSAPAREWMRSVGRSSSYVNDLRELEAGLQLLGSAELRPADLAAAAGALHRDGATLEFWHGALDAIAPLAALQALLDETWPGASSSLEGRAVGGSPKALVHVSEDSGHGCFLAKESTLWWKSAPPADGGSSIRPQEEGWNGAAPPASVHDVEKDGRR